MNTLKLRKQASKLVLAIALATGTAMIAGHVAPAEAQAQRKKKEKDKKEDKKPQYSNEWREAFVPLSEQLKAEGADPRSFTGQIDQVVSISQSGDEKLQTGQLIYNAGIRLSEIDASEAGQNAAYAMRFRGMEMMIGSGKTPPDAVGQYNFIAYQLAAASGQNEKSRSYLQTAIDVGYSGNQSQSELLVALAQTYFSTDEYAKGLQVLDDAIASKQAAGEPVEERLFEFAFSVAYREDLQPQVYDYAIRRAQLFPTDENWTNAFNVVRVLNEYGAQETLDILRLKRIAQLLDDKQDFIIYVETADARVLPQEVKDVIEQGYATGEVERDDTFIADQLRIATNRIESDREELPVLEQDARAAGADLATVRAAGSAFLSYGEFDKAVEFYSKTATMPGGDTEETLTRLGMAQVGMEDYESAKATFAKITGPRMPIARIWAGYAEYQSGGASAQSGPTGETVSAIEAPDNAS